jgi:hypothetical protein
VQLPYRRLGETPLGSGGALLSVVVELAHRRFKTGHRVVALASAELEKGGVSRWAKRRALRQLERAGLVSVSQKGKQSPQVTILW